jgi:4-carboxymuconolactone decarboxylase
MNLFARSIVLLLTALAFATSPSSTASADTPDDAGGNTPGREMQSKVYADIPADDPWLEMSQNHLFAEIWSRPGLSLRDRRLIALTAAAYAGSREGYVAHLTGALDHGDLSQDELWEWLLQFTQYAGYPKAAPVWSEYRRLLAARGLKPLPKTLGPGND